MIIKFHNDPLFVSESINKIISNSSRDSELDILFVSHDDPLRCADSKESPFSVTKVSLNGIYHIVYNKSIIDKCDFTGNEILAMLAHEISHLLIEESGLTVEISCDKFASDLGLGLSLATALIKINNFYTVYGLKERLDSLSKDISIYRPEWMSGRYNEKSQVAICYNLIAGVSHFFESYSALVIGFILSLSRNGMLKLSKLSDKTGISVESLVPFIDELQTLGLAIDFLPNKDFVLDYRKKVSIFNRERSEKLSLRSTKEKLPYAISNAERLYTEKVGGITSVMLEMTYRCSEKCIHCYNIGATRNDDEVSSRGDREELTLEEYKKLIDDLYEQGLVKVCLSGGDPFSKSFVWEIIDYLYKKDIVFDVFTNGQAIVKDCRKLADYYPRLVGVSIYSGDAKIHDYITRIEGSWIKSMKVIEQLSELAVPLNIKCCVMRPNVKSYFMIADIAKQYGAVPQYELNITDSIEGDTCASKYLRLTTEQLEIVLRDSNVPIYVGEEAPNFGGQKKDMNENPCGAGENALCITPEGNVIPCCAFHLHFGNVRDNKIGDIINESKERANWLNLKLTDYEDCGNFKYCDYCNLCPGNNFIENQTPLKASDVNCYMAKVRYNLAQKIKLGLDPLNGEGVRAQLSRLSDYTPTRMQKEMS